MTINKPGISINKRRAQRAVRLTELSVRNARPAKTAYLVWDTHQRGLALRVQPTGSQIVVGKAHFGARRVKFKASSEAGLAAFSRAAF